jgi:mono/diheme cytochrome c family protein
MFLSKAARLFLVLLTASAGSGVCAMPVNYELPPEIAALKAGPQSDVAQANCSVCHSVDYITTQPKGKGSAFWNSEINKMIKVFGASIEPGDANDIAAYLSNTY